MAARTAGKGLSRAPAGAWLGVVGSGGDGLRGTVVGRLGWYTGAHQTFVRTTVFLCIFCEMHEFKCLVSRQVTDDGVSLYFCEMHEFKKVS